METPKPQTLPLSDKEACLVMAGIYEKRRRLFRGGPLLLPRQDELIAKALRRYAESLEG